MKRCASIQPMKPEMKVQHLHIWKMQHSCLELEKESRVTPPRIYTPYLEDYRDRGPWSYYASQGISDIGGIQETLYIRTLYSS